MKRFGIIIMGTALALSLAACGCMRSTETIPTTTATTPSTAQTTPILDPTVIDPTIMDPTSDTNIPDPTVDSNSTDATDSILDTTETTK